LFVGGTMIRHALHSCTVTATSGSVHGATTRSCLIAPPSFPLVLAADILRAGSEAVDLAAIAVPADKNLRAAATTHKQSARHFIGAVRHINPQPSAVSSSLQPRADRAGRRARASQGQALRVAAKTRPALTGPARDGCAIWRSGRKNARGAGRTKEWNLRTQYPNRYSTSPHPTGVAMFGIIPDRRSHGGREHCPRSRAMAVTASAQAANIEAERQAFTTLPPSRNPGSSSPTFGRAKGPARLYQKTLAKRLMQRAAAQALLNTVFS